MTQVGGWMGCHCERQCAVESSRDATMAESHRMTPGPSQSRLPEYLGVSPHSLWEFPSCRQAGIP